MKAWSLPILATLAFASSLAFAQNAAPSKPADASAKGLVNIACNPSCDEVVIDGRSYGPSPLVRLELPAGAHEVTLKRKTIADKRTQIVVKGGQVSSMRFELTSPPPPPAQPPPEIAARVAVRAKFADGWLNVQCDPGCDEVIIAGKRYAGGAASNVPLPAGTYEVTAKRKGAPDKTIKMRVVEGQTTAVRVAMNSEAAAAMPTEAEARAALEKKFAAATATRAEMKLLRAICTRQGDQACREKVDARLRALRAE